MPDRMFNAFIYQGIWQINCAVHMLRSCPLLRVEEFRYCDRVFDVFPVLLSCFVVIAPFPI